MFALAAREAEARPLHTLWAVVNSDGSLGPKARRRVQKTADGAYTIVFNRRVTNCAYTATLGGSNQFYALDRIVQATNAAGGNVNAVGVSTKTLDGTSANLPFFLVVNC